MNGTRSDEELSSWLPLVIVLSVVVFIFQIFPSLWSTLLWAGNVTHWTRQVWLIVFGVACGVCVVIRFAPNVLEALRGRSALQAQQHAKNDQAKQLKEARERRERMEASRRRRMY